MGGNEMDKTNISKKKTKRKSVSITDGLDPKREKVDMGEISLSAKLTSNAKGSDNCVFNMKTDISGVQHQGMKESKREMMDSGNVLLSMKQASNPNENDNRGLKMMMGMGYRPGEGLGLQHQGMKEPVSASTQQSRRGIGLREEDFVKPDTVWTPGMDEASSTGDIVASLIGERFFIGGIDHTDHMIIGKKLINIDEETHFCDPELLAEMVKCKTVLDQHSAFLDGRSRSNPYEKIAAGIFLNRAAMKMANMDSVTDDLFTKTENNETLFFADICAGPGGFTEYMLWRRPLQSCGFGFTLKAMNDFKLRDILCGPVECFHPSYGAHDDGDIFNEENLRKFQQEVYSSTDDLGVHTVLADGGFSVEGQENIQEILSKQLYLCQFLCAINILRNGGNFLCKLFDTFTDFSVELIHLVSVLFRKVSIIKPITSRPANSERYIVFHDFIANSEHLEEIRSYLYEINKKVNELKTGEDDVLKIVSRKVLKRDPEFCKFIRDQNDTILRQQIIALAKLHSFIVDRNLIDDRQYDIRNEALKLWNVPDLSREQFKSNRSPQPITALVNINERNYYGGLKTAATKAITHLTNEELKKEKFVVRNHYAGFVSRTTSDFKHTTYVIVKDKKIVRWYEAGVHCEPVKLNDIGKKWLLTLPSFTILLVHFGVEYKGSKANLKCNCITVVDAAAIYSEDITNLPYTERMAKVTHLCKLLDPKQNGHIKPIEFFQLSNIHDYLREKLTLKKAKGVTMQNMISAKGDHYFPPGTLLIINGVKDPWMVAVSRSSGSTYYFNVQSRQSTHEQPPCLYAPFSESAIHEVDWAEEADSFMSTVAKKI